MQKNVGPVFYGIRRIWKPARFRFVTSMMNEGIWEGIQRKSTEAVQILFSHHVDQFTLQDMATLPTVLETTLV